MKKLIHAVLLAATVLAFALATEARTSFEIDEFIDGRDGTATLVITCGNKKRLRIVFDRKRLNKIDIERLYDHLEGECGQQR